MDGACVDPPVKELCPVTCGVCEAEEEVEEEEEVEAPACLDDDAAFIEMMEPMITANPMITEGPMITGCADPNVDWVCDDPEFGPPMKELCPVTCGVCEAEEEAEE